MGVTLDIGYLVKRINYLNELIGKPPKVHVSQDKNIKLLIALIEKKQFNQTDKKARVGFTLKEYAKYRGFTEEELQLLHKVIMNFKKHYPKLKVR